MKATGLDFSGVISEAGSCAEIKDCTLQEQVILSKITNDTKIQIIVFKRENEIYDVNIINNSWVITSLKYFNLFILLYIFKDYFDKIMLNNTSKIDQQTHKQ